MLEQYRSYVSRPLRPFLRPSTEKDASQTNANAELNNGTVLTLREAFDPGKLTDPPLTASESGLQPTLTETKRQIGTFSAFFLIFNRMVGTGIFATPSTIFSLSGSVGLSLFIWVAGMIIAATGMAVYLEFGTALPKNGGEKNYLEFVYRKPKYLVTGFYTGYVILLGKHIGKNSSFVKSVWTWTLTSAISSSKAGQVQTL